MGQMIQMFLRFEFQKVKISVRRTRLLLRNSPKPSAFVRRRGLRRPRSTELPGEGERSKDRGEYHTR